ncbi:hypothetical protein FGO68_gene8223 [Halteria grandinella]|uniref:Uncharacterized protein n=1 Tax=Halteria grandinella TaxID=5974 RepID=A0A8J8N9G7_HALGN|nr:hypothetical protein FGO68_gene8223 [Halteria grandinella]
MFNMSETSSKILSQLANAQPTVKSDPTFRIDSMLEWSNPALYSIQTRYENADSRLANQGSNNYYFIAYAVATSFVFFSLLFSLVFANYFYRISKRENFKEGVKIFARALAAIQFTLITLFAVPIFTILLQGFQCEEDGWSSR